MTRENLVTRLYTCMEATKVVNTRSTSGSSNLATRNYDLIDRQTSHRRWKENISKRYMIGLGIAIEIVAKSVKRVKELDASNL